MKVLSETTTAGLYWTQPYPFERRFELRAEVGLLGELCFESMWGTLAAADTAAGHWAFKWADERK